MLFIRKSAERGYAELDWLKSWHSFSFAAYFDPQYMGFGPLRVINEDYIAPGGGFATHPHRDMEIITYLLDGELEHKDSMGNGSVIRPGEIQRMSAGTGVRHSEFNPSAEQESHLLQIWILPDREGHRPAYEQKHFAPARQQGIPCLIASPDGRAGSVSINQQTDVYSVLLDGADFMQFACEQGRKAWVQVARGRLEINGHTLRQGDGLAVDGPEQLGFENADHAELLLFDLPGE